LPFIYNIDAGTTMYTYVS